MTTATDTKRTHAIWAAAAALGVSTAATEDEIKRAFRLAASLTHPDHNPGNKAASDEFRRIRLAYDILTAFAGGAVISPRQVKDMLAMPLPQPTPDPRIVAAYTIAPPRRPSIDLSL